MLKLTAETHMRAHKLRPPHMQGNSHSQVHPPHQMLGPLSALCCPLLMRLPSQKPPQGHCQWRGELSHWAHTRGVLTPWKGRPNKCWRHSMQVLLLYPLLHRPEQHQWHQQAAE